jgi:hypothetical protein
MRRCTSVLRCRLDWTDGVRVVGVCRLGLMRSNRDSRCTLLCGETEEFLGVVEGVVIRIRVCVCVREFSVDGVRGVNTLDRLDEVFVDCWPSRVPISRERDRLDDRDWELLGDGVVVGVLAVCGVRE